MKYAKLLSTGVLLLLLGTVAPTFAQERHEEEAKAPKQEKQAKPEKQQHAVSKQKQEKAQQSQAKSQQKQQQSQAKSQQKQDKENQQQAKGEQKQVKEHQQQAKGEQKQVKEHQQQAKGEQKQGKAQQSQAKSQQQGESSQRPQRTSQQEARQRREPTLRLSARGDGRIPDARFRSHFGREHRFRIGSPRMVGGYSRFQYGGYWFGFVNPWPEGWYYTDDVYIDYLDGGYYLYDPYYPGVRISICVVV